jgi:hypothetical protein
MFGQEILDDTVVAAVGVKASRGREKWEAVRAIDDLLGGSGVGAGFKYQSYSQPHCPPM